MSADTVTGRGMVGVARWAARLWAAGLVLFWRAFFVEHVAWFADPQRLPPPWVFLLAGLHFLMLVGLLIGWKWELAGAVVALASSLPFFATAAGRNFPLFTLVAAGPSVLWLYCAWHDRRRRIAGQPDDGPG